MPRKIDISQMTTEEIVAYAEKVKQQNRDRVTKYYKNTIKTCKEANKRQYYKKNEQHEQLVLS